VAKMFTMVVHACWCICCGIIQKNVVVSFRKIGGMYTSPHINMLPLHQVHANKIRLVRLKVNSFGHERILFHECTQLT
jgi:hypothetical protein